MKDYITNYIEYVFAWRSRSGDVNGCPQELAHLPESVRKRLNTGDDCSEVVANLKASSPTIDNATLREEIGRFLAWRRDVLSTSAGGAKLGKMIDNDENEYIRLRNR